MKRPNYMFVLSILGVLILSICAIGPALADAPDHTKDTFEGDFDLYFCEFDITAHLEEKSVQNYFYDRFGGDRADTIHYVGVLTLTSNGHTMTVRNNEYYHIEWISETDAIMHVRGANWVGTIPGHGVVIGTLGNQEILETCHEEVTEEGETEWVCEYQPIDFSGWNFTDMDTLCNYMLTGE
jgi:hypothetical protein